MRVRGSFYLSFILLTILYISSLSSAIVTHENFEKSDEDISAVIAFFDDARLLVENSLETSLQGGCAIDFTGNVTFSYSSEKMSSSLAKSRELQQRLSFDKDLLNRLKGNASSYQYFKDLLLPLRQLADNVSSFTETHFQMVSNFSRVVDFQSSGFMNISIFLYSLVNIQVNITRSIGYLRNIERVLDTINESFSKSKINDLVTDLNLLLGDYDHYVNLLLNLVDVDEPQLWLYVNKKSVYLQDEIHGYGYFLAGKLFVGNQTVEVIWDNQKINHSLTNQFGRYEFIKKIGLYETPGVHNLSVSTFFNNSVYRSSNINITVEKIPTKIVLKTSRNDYYLNESICFYGYIADYRNHSLQVDFNLSFAGSNFTISTGSNGRFNFCSNEILTFGRYKAKGFFSPPWYYQPCTSKEIIIRVNTPTFLKVDVSNQKIYSGERLKVYGILTSIIDNSGLGNQTIGLFLDDEKIASIVTNTSGFYHFELDTDSLKTGRYNLWARFISSDVQWRSCKSKSVDLTVVKPVEQGFFIIGVLLVCSGLLFFAVLFYFRKQILDWFKKEEVSKEDVLSSPSRLDERVDKSSISFNVDDFLIDVKQKDKDVFREEVISKYRSLLVFLFRYGMVFPTGFTHLDVRKVLINKGFSKKATDVITRVFEYARYSPYVFEKNDVLLFNKYMKKIFDKIGG